GPSKPSEFGKEMAEFTTVALRGKLSSDEWKELERREGHWPDYPKRLIAQAREKDLNVPGITIPGEPSKWERFYRPQRGVKPGRSARTPAARTKRPGSPSIPSTRRARPSHNRV